MWDMIDLSAMPPGHPGVQSGDVSLHHAFQERFWEHTPTSTTDFWDEYSRVCKNSAVLMFWSASVFAISFGVRGPLKPYPAAL